METAGFGRRCIICYLDRYYLQSAAGKTAKEYKQFKGLKKENLRDNMTNSELVLNMLAEVSTKDISEAENPDTFALHAQVAKRGGNVAKTARKQLEKELRHSVISPENAKTLGIAGSMYLPFEDEESKCHSEFF